MASTAIGAAGEDARTITFMSKEHKEFYLEYLPKCRWKDVYHEALVYCLGIDRDTRKHVNKIYDFKNGSVKPECLQEGGGKTTTTINLGVVFRLKRIAMKRKWFYYNDIDFMCENNSIFFINSIVTPYI